MKNKTLKLSQKIRKIITLTSVLFIFLLAYCSCSWAQVVFVNVPEQPSPVEMQLESVCQFYGLNITRMSVSEDGLNFVIADVFEKSDSQAIVIDARGFAYVDMEDVLLFLVKEHDKKVSVLVLGLTPEIDSSILSKWSNGAVVGGARATGLTSAPLWTVSDLREISRQLAGLTIPITTGKIDYLILEKGPSVQTIIQMKGNNEKDTFPIFVKTIFDGQDVFFLTENNLSRSSAESSQQFSIEHFLEIAPLMMFLRHACGERCWHSTGHYANLTIDDPWLTEPYGHLSYVGLIEQMDKINFHTTIAFIPWNYDRNKMNVISLFKKHPDRFSICLHGNNHDHYEFYKYETNTTDPWPAKPLSIQEENIKQAVARMKKFEQVTGLTYSSVMVFPHGIAPAETLQLLKKYNFLAASDEDNVPLGSNKPNDPLNSLRSVTMNFGNFASLDRDSVGIREENIAIDLFLGNPILLYGHHDLFKKGMEAFNQTAEIINRIEPTVEWQNLDYIARHLYLKRLRVDGSYDVRAFCRIIELENTQNRDLTFFIRKEESFSPPIRKVTVDGNTYPYDRSCSDLSLDITIPAGEFKIIDIEYENDLDVTSIDISKNDPRVNQLRKLSDFRDITLSRNILGRVFTYVYYEADLYKLGIKKLGIISLILTVTICRAGWPLLKRIRRHRLQRLKSINKLRYGT